MAESATPLAAARGGVRVRIKVAPKAARDRVGPVRADAGGAVLKVSVTAPPERGKANDAVVRLLAKAWGIPRRRIAIEAGAGARRKVVFVAGDPSELMAALGRWMEETR